MQRILVVRNDKLGDFMLALPSFASLRAHLPDAYICALVTDYTRDIAIDAKWIDDVIIDPGKKSGFGGLRRLAATIRAQRFDAAIALFSTFRIGWCLYNAGIEYRLAPKTKLAQLWFNHTLLQRRSQSIQPEFRYNLALIQYFLRAHGVTVLTPVKPPFLQYSEEIIAVRRRDLQQRFAINDGDMCIFIHPGHGGSSNNLPLQQYAALAQQLVGQVPLQFIVTAGPGEHEQAVLLAHRIGPRAHVLSGMDLITFAQYVQLADLFISGSTGTLHIAGALNRKTAAFYPRLRTAAALRWQSLNDENRQLAFSPPLHAGENDMHAIDIAAAAEHINRAFLI